MTTSGCVICHHIGDRARILLWHKRWEQKLIITQDTAGRSWQNMFACRTRKKDWPVCRGQKFSPNFDQISTLKIHTFNFSLSFIKHMLYCENILYLQCLLIPSFWICSPWVSPCCVVGWAFWFFTKCPLRNTLTCTLLMNHSSKIFPN